ncbi:DEBR0S1_00386g1_1 [Brettanomyces bruxellensis]|uniref:DEBR0S1_00386g1_1 n=1 Tax=Dekkera bruxellensis TaxID=5007 RepID=A0A7D9GWL1_DEKBR|nr:DEBR0S1_00386g1_1 [Brettanomyces bruxellensis]
MLENKDLALIGVNDLRLVPYVAAHVLRYHQWMKDPYILEMTESETVSLEEEYALQKSWGRDAKKCTFIISTTNKDLINDANEKLSLENMPALVYADNGNKKQGCIIGDVNLYIVSNPDEPLRAELEIMIAEKNMRRNGYALGAIKMMMKYTRDLLRIKFFEVRISLKNAASINLFKNRLGFKEVEVSEFFNEIHLELDVSEDTSKEVQQFDNAIIRMEKFSSCS